MSRGAQGAIDRSLRHLAKRVTRLEDEVAELRKALGKPDAAPTPAASAEGAEGADLAAPRFYDLRAEQDYQYPGDRRKARLRGGEPVLRDPRDVTGVVLHQTAVEYGLSARQIRAAGGDEDLALARRGLDVACHAIAFRRGIYVATHPLRNYVNHGNGYNASTLGLEVEGNYAGLESDPARTTWRGEPTELTAQTIETARAALRWLVEAGWAEGMPLRRIYAHRQSSATRRSDPGEALWKALVPWAEETLGLEAVPGDARGDGRPIPRQWDPRGSVAY
jgi:hypothetical protein